MLFMMLDFEMLVHPCDNEMKRGETYVEKKLNTEL